jgi:hypothetical protein
MMMRPSWILPFYWSRIEFAYHQGIQTVISPRDEAAKLSCFDLPPFVPASVAAFTSRLAVYKPFQSLSFSFSPTVQPFTI